ncbi:hypothetical protein [Chitinophaga sp. Ak27]|uniref:hypothetical protein n=1 Tax=Chitinophaga sp. Ak27 TaxID=2726116 RepID=UPI00145F9762|nr:hypothetical protein [Chitinophaga sp. Ak27]NLU94908.1 hypothetical protein [Chitinophaga sp. Ak27]
MVFIQAWFEYLNLHLSKEDTKSILPFERQKKLDFEWLPENDEEFYMVIENAKPEILEAFGFIRYSSLPGEFYRQCQPAMDKLLGPGRDLFLFPVEWYGIIPRNFVVFDIAAERFPFEHQETLNDARSGCLSFDIALRVGDL